MTKKNAVRYFFIPLIAILVFWLGGYGYFRSSDDWQEIQRLLAQSPTVVSKVGKVQQISVSPMPFIYRFSGDSGSATLRISVIGSSGEYRTTVQMRKLNGVWLLPS